MNRRPAMTLVEMVIAVILVGGGLFLLVGWTRMARQEAQARLAADLLARLDRALAAYFDAERAYPATTDNDPDPVVAALLRHPASRALFEKLPDSLWRPRPPRTLLDPWGGPLRYLRDPDRPEVRANGGRPIFISAGRDRVFGASFPAALADDLRSDDPQLDAPSGQATTAAGVPVPAPPSAIQLTPPPA